MKVLITGSNGYLGTKMVPFLRERGHSVLGLDNDLFGDCTFCGDRPDYDYIRKDVRNVEVSDLEGHDAVIHLAALSNDPLGDLKPEVTYEINHRASVRLAKLSREAGVERFLFSSSCSIYGANGLEMLTEEAEPHPITPYAISKLRAEEGISTLANDGFVPVFLRSSTAYGATPKLRLDLVLNNLVASAHATGVVLLKSDGLSWRPIVHVEDISRAFAAVLESPSDLVYNQVFNVGSTHENYQINELAEIARNTVPGSRIEYSENAAPDKRCYRVDCSKLARVIPKFKPQWNAARGAEELYSAFSMCGLTEDDFSGPRYKRIEHLKNLIDSGSLDSSFRNEAQAPEIGGK
jgi:nucleoside-diphosphate-sugar epimerase